MSNLVVIEKYYDIGEAMVMKSYLESHDIPCTLHSYEHASVEPMAILALQGIGLQVDADQQEEARRLLDNISDEHPAADEETPSAQPLSESELTCPQCGGSSLRRVRGTALSFPALIFFHVPFWRRTKKMRCLTCNAVVKT